METYGTVARVYAESANDKNAAESRSYGISKTKTLSANDIVMFLLIGDFGAGDQTDKGWTNILSTSFTKVGVATGFNLDNS